MNLKKPEQLKNIFLDQYREESSDRQKKMEYLFYFAQIGLLFFGGLMLLRIFGNSNAYLLAGDIFIGLFLIFSLISIYFKRPVMAGNMINLLPFTVLFYHVVERYFLGSPMPLDSIFASLAFLVFGYLFLSLFAIRRLQLVMYSIMAALTLIVHYWVVVQVSFDGQYNSVNITHIVAALMGLAAAAIMASLVLKVLHEVMRVDREEHSITKNKYTSLFSKMTDAFGYFRVIYQEKEPVDLKVIEYNEALSKLLGVNGENLQNKRIKQVQVREELNNRLDFWVDLFHKVATDKKEHYEDFYSPALDQWFLLTVFSPQNDECVLIMKDVTEMKKQQQELLKAKEGAEESDRLKSSFLNTISHEVRTPLNQITGLLNIVQDTYTEDKEIKELVRLVNHSANYLTEIIDNLLEASLMQSTGVVPKYEKTNLQRIIDDAIRFLHDEIKVAGKEQVITFEYRSDIPGDLQHLTTDPHMLEHILKKLLSNAVKYTSEGQIILNCYPRGSNLIFEVADTGIGIEEEKQKLIFDKFRQADEGSTRRYGGLGLGLAISSYFASILGGKITLESTSGQGSHFCFHHPVK